MEALGLQLSFDFDQVLHEMKLSDRDTVLEFANGLCDRLREVARIPPATSDWIEQNGVWMRDVGFNLKVEVRRRFLFHYQRECFEVACFTGFTKEAPIKRTAYSISEAKEIGDDFLMSMLRGWRDKDEVQNG